jgi:general secretion pathway protein C
MISRASWSNFSSLDGEAVNRLLPPLVSFVLVVLISWQIAKMIWLLVPGSAAGVPVQLPDTMPQSATSSPVETDVNAIAASHIFGIADAEPLGPAPVAEPMGDLADTRINLTLNGTVASEIPNYSVAIISDGGNDQKVYTIGETIVNGATLHAVYPDRVVLNEKGTFTNLKLPRDFEDSPARTVRQAMPTSRQSIDDSKSLQAVVQENLTKLTDVIRPTPYRVQGEQVGFRVYPGRDRRQFAALGLRPGDIIKDIDGQTLADASQAMQIFQSLGTAEQVTVTLERDGEDQTLTLTTSQLDLSDEQTQ